MEIVFSLGILLIVGYFFGLVAERFKLPKVTFYLIAGVLFSHDLLGHLVHLKFNSWSENLLNICLGIIAFVVGGKIKFFELLRNSKLIFVTTLMESAFAVIFVFLGFYLVANLLGIDSKLAVLLASVAATTAPAATMAVIEQYNAKGKMTDTILGVVALDDALGIIIFSIISSFLVGNGSMELLTILKEIFLALLIGGFLGFLLSTSAKLSESNDYLFPLLIGMIFLVEGLSEKWHFSFLLGCIALGFVSNNFFNAKDEKASLLLPIVHIEDFVFMIFFIFAGLHFSVDYFFKASHIIAFYVIFRATGKYVGAYVGTSFFEGASNFKKYIGLSFMPQAGIAIGLVFQIVHIPGFEKYSDIMVNAVLGSTLVYELLGPLLARYSFKLAKEI